MAPQKPQADYDDPFSAGQLLGMTVMLTFIDQNPDITPELIDQMRAVTVNSLQAYLDKPAEDIYLMVDNLVKEIKI